MRFWTCEYWFLLHANSGGGGIVQKAIELNYNGLTLRGMEHVPVGATDGIPAVVFYHGFTGTSIEPHRMFVKICRALERVGIASFRFDFSGSGESDGDFEDMTLSGEVAEAHAIFDLVKADPRIDATRISVAGLSMGGLVASLVAGDRPDDVYRLALLAPAGGQIQDLVLNLLKDSGVDFHVYSEFIDYLGNLVSRRFVEELSNFNVYQRASYYNGPVLIIHGTEDSIVPASVVTEYRDQAYGGRAKVHFIEGGDHTFDKHVSEAELIETLVAYLSSGA
jgi:pimeloyl-ACP methyl ester carboxylesterase